MSNLKKVITNYIECEKKINNDANKKSLLEEKFDEKLKNQSTNNYTVNEVEVIYAADHAIKEHTQDIENCKRSMENSADIIIKHLSLLKGKPIVDASLFKDESGNQITYSFWIGADEKICYNPKK